MVPRHVPERRIEAGDFVVGQRSAVGLDELADLEAGLLEQGCEGER